MSSSLAFGVFSPFSLIIFPTLYASLSLSYGLGTLLGHLRLFAHHHSGCFSVLHLQESGCPRSLRMLLFFFSKSLADSCHYRQCRGTQGFRFFSRAPSSMLISTLWIFRLSSFCASPSGTSSGVYQEPFSPFLSPPSFESS